MPRHGNIHLRNLTSREENILLQSNGEKGTDMKIQSILTLALLLSLVPPSAFARGLVKYAIMKGTGDYASRGYLLASLEKMSCGQLAARCINVSTKRPDRAAMCGGAGASCRQTGVFVGPYSHAVIPVTQR
jgi:hypothetical protein